MYEHILIATDGSDSAEAAGRHAQELASTVDATLHVISCVEPIPLGKIPAGTEAASSDHHKTISIQEKLGTLAIDTIADQAKGTGISVVEDLLYGPPPSEIIDYATENDIDLIVLGTKGITGSRRFLIGSVAEKVVRQSDTPVLTIRG